MEESFCNQVFASQGQGDGKQEDELEDRMAFGRSYQHGVVSSLAFRNVLALDGRGIPAAKIRNPNSSCPVVFFLYFSRLDGSGRPIR